MIRFLGFLPLVLCLGACVQIASFTEQDANTASQIDPLHRACYGEMAKLSDSLAQGGGLLTAIAIKERSHDLLRGSCAPITADIAVTVMRIRAGTFAFVPLVVAP